VELKQLAERASLPKVLRALKLFSQVELGSENHSALPLELAIVDSTMKIEEDAPKPVRQIEYQPQPAPTPVHHTPPMQHPAAGQAQSQSAAQDAKKPETVSNSTPPAVAEKRSPLEAGSISEKLRREWRTVLEQAPADVKRHPAIAILRSGVRPVLFENDMLTLSSRHPIYKDKLEEIENHKVVEKIISSYLGHTCKVQCILENGNNPMKEALKLGAQIEVEEE
jgi:hypothetical protein